MVTLSPRGIHCQLLLRLKDVLTDVSKGQVVELFFPGWYYLQISYLFIYLFIFIATLFIYLFIYFWLCWVFGSCEGFL